MAGPRGRTPQRTASGRGQTERLGRAKGRKPSSARWLRRQLSDPYVARARREGYRSRAAYKLVEIDDRFGLFGPGTKVVDLGAAPGSWTQVAVRRVRAGRPDGGRVVAVDVAEMEPVPGAVILTRDVFAEDLPGLVGEALDGRADVVLSDMAAPATGHARTDHLRVMALCEAALDLAMDLLAPGGAFVAKVLRGGTERALFETLRRAFARVRHFKPAASRPDSAEVYVVATGFRAQPRAERH